MKTLLLDPATWDLVLDASGNIAVASDPYSIAQDVASACQLFLGELYYDTSKGVPYFDQFLGHQPSPAFLNAQLEAAALTVPSVVSAKAYVTGFSGRELSGQIQTTDINGTTTVVNL